MLKYLIIQLDDTSPSFCHYPNNKSSVRRLIEFDVLHEGLIWAMKENLMVQFVHPDYTLPPEYLELINTVDHIDIEKDNVDADISVFDGIESVSKLKDIEYPNVVIRLSKNELFNSVGEIKKISNRQSSLNIVITDIDSFKEEDFKKYNSFLKMMASIVIEKLKSNKPVKINLLTDRLLLRSMNNCNAGDEHITLAPDGNFYICPAFYIEGKANIGNPTRGVLSPNAQLFKLAKAPICRNCDAFQCKRCVWLNQRMTLEVNTPSHEQCVVSHLERNATRCLLEQIKNMGIIETDITISEIKYLDPFNNIKR